MAPEGKERKRKATPASAVQTDPPHKKSRKATADGSASEPKKKGSQVVNDLKDQENAMSAAPVTKVNEAAVKSKKSRKRAADFLDEDEEVATKMPAVAEEAPVVEAQPVDKPKKVKKSKKSNAEEKINGTNNANGVTKVEKEAVTATTTEKPKKKKKKSDVARTSDAKEVNASSEPHPVQKKKKPSTAAFHADRIDQILDASLTKLAAKQPLTTDGVSGDVEDNSNEELDEAPANESIPTSMQAEAQHTVDQELEDEFGSDEEEADDQGAALLTGFDSDNEDPAQDDGFDPDTLQPFKPNKKTSKKITRALQKGNTDGPGTVYVGRIPHGFYEHPMRNYFSQFGNITRLRLSRNRKTGASKHFAFIEFESNEVAKIVAESMNNYLMFGHILKCAYAPQETLHPDLWKGANKRFHKVPYNKLDKQQLEKPKTKEQWDHKIDKEQKKREQKAEKLKKIGYEMEMPKLKTPGEVLERKKLQKAEEVKAIEADDESGPVGALAPPDGVPNDEVAKEIAKKPRKDRRRKKSSAVGEHVAAELPAGSEVVKEDVEAPATITPSVTAAESVVEKKKKRKETKASKKQLDAQLRDELKAATSETAVLSALAATSDAPSESAFPQFDDEMTAPPAPAAGKDGDKKPKRQRRARKSENDGGVALPSPAPATTEAAHETKPEAEPETKVEKKEKSKKQKLDLQAKAVAVPTLAPAILTIIPEAKLEKKEKSKKRKSDEAIEPASVRTSLPTITATVPEIMIGQKEKPKKRKSNADAETIAPPTLALAMSTNDPETTEPKISAPEPKGEKKEKVKKRKSDAGVEPEVTKTVKKSKKA